MSGIPGETEFAFQEGTIRTTDLRCRPGTAMVLNLKAMSVATRDVAAFWMMPRNANPSLNVFRNCESIEDPARICRYAAFQIDSPRSGVASGGHIVFADLAGPLWNFIREPIRIVHSSIEIAPASPFGFEH